MKLEHNIGLMALIVVIAAASVTIGPQLTGNMARVQGTLVGFTEQRPELTAARYIGKEYARESADICLDEMRYAGRRFSRYIRCCQHECLPECLDANISEYDVDDCLDACSRTCVDMMTQHYLDIQPGTWR